MASDNMGREHGSNINVTKGKQASSGARSRNTEGQQLARRESQQQMQSSQPESFVSQFFGGGRGVSPFALMRRIFDDMDRAIENFGLGQRSQYEPGFGLWVPQVEVIERDGKLLVRADLPGVKDEDIRVEVRDNNLILEGERTYSHSEERGGVWRSEVSYGTFHRAIPLPAGVDVDDAEARFADGVLEITMKLPPGAEGKRIEVQRGSSTTSAQGNERFAESRRHD